MRGRPNLHIINIHEIRNPNNKTIEKPNICYLSQQLDSKKLTNIIIMSINSKVLHITSFEYLFNSFLNIVSLNHLGQHQFIVTRNSISSSPWQMKLSAGMFAGSRTMRAVGHSCTGIFSADGKQAMKEFHSWVLLENKKLRPVFQTSPCLAFLVVSPHVRESGI